MKTLVAYSLQVVEFSKRIISYGDSVDCCSGLPLIKNLGNSKNKLCGMCLVPLHFHLVHASKLGTSRKPENLWHGEAGKSIFE